MFAHFRLLLFLVILLPGCDLPLSRNSTGSILYPGGAQPATGGQSLPQAQPQAPASYRTQHVWDKAMQGMTMGGAFGGVYGAGAGLLVGLITGLFTAEAEYAQLNNQIQSEQAKDKDLEARIEQEMQRQRELDNQLANQIVVAARQAQPEPPQTAPKPKSPNLATPPKKESVDITASIGNKERPPNPPASPFKNVEVRDINGDTVPDLWIYYNPLKPGERVRQEEATRGDGTVDTWSYFKDGKLVRREVDTKGKGIADTVYHYENDKIAREERDENGTGHVSFRVLYQNGRRAKVEKDSTGGGKPDTWIYYDVSSEQEIVLKEERDLNGDGVVDSWSYFDNGRLVRRDLSATGLDLVSAADTSASSQADLNETSPPAPRREPIQRSVKSRRTASK